MDPIKQFIDACAQMALLAGLDNITYGHHWLQAIYDLYQTSNQMIQQANIQETIIQVGQYMKIMAWPEQETYLRYCEKLLPIDCLLEILDKYPILQGSYQGNNQAVRSYLTILS